MKLGVSYLNFDKLKQSYISEYNKREDIMDLEAWKAVTNQTVATVEKAIEIIEKNPNNSYTKDLPKLKNFVKWYNGTFVKMLDKKIVKKK